MRYGSPTSRLPHPPIDLAEQSRSAYISAREAVRASAELVRTSQELREEREHWRLLWSTRLANPELFLSCCMYCGRMRSHDEDWLAIPRRIGNLLRTSNVPFLSHGICPECLDEHLPP